MRLRWVGLSIATAGTCALLAGCTYRSGGHFEYGGAVLTRAPAESEQPAAETWLLDAGGRWLASGFLTSGESAWARFVNGDGEAITVYLDDDARADLSVGNTTISLDDTRGCLVTGQLLGDEAAGGGITCSSEDGAVGSFDLRWAAAWYDPRRASVASVWPTAMPFNRALSPSSWNDTTE